MVLVPPPTEKYVKFSPGLIPAIKYVPKAVYECRLAQNFSSQNPSVRSLFHACAPKILKTDFWELC